jgi:hypothetical protein
VPTARRPPLALLAAFALAACGRPPEPAAPPRLSVAEATHDVGQVPQGVPVEHAFALRNEGGAPLTLIELRAGCDCSAALEGDRDLPPGGQVTVRLRCDTSRTPGPQRRTLTVYSNDPEHRVVVLAVTGTVVLVAAAEPARVYLGPVVPGTGAARVVALRAGDDGVRFGGVAGGAPQLRPRLADVDGVRALLLDVATDAPPGPFTTVVRVHTTSPARPVIEVPVAGIVVAPTPGAGGSPR